MGGLRLRLSHVMPSVWACKVKDTRRMSTMERDEAPLGLAEKFCLSPVNRKSMDIAYPTRNGESETVVSVKRKHLRRATVVSVGCGCRGRRSATKKETKTEHSLANADVKSLAKDFNSDYCWEKEDGWHVIAKVNDEIVRKKVVLKRRTENAGKKCPPGSPASSPDVVNSCLARTLTANAQTKRRRRKKKVVKPSESTCNYRLSTSSADTVQEASTYSWDKEYGSFSSDNDEVLCSPLVSIYQSFSSQSGFEFSEAPQLSTIDESPRNSNSLRVSLKGRRRSGHKRMHKRHREARKKLPAEFSANSVDIESVHTPSPPKAEKLPLLSSPDSAKLEVKDDTSSTTCSSAGGGGYDQSAFYPWLSSEAEDLEANAKTWRESSLRRDGIRTVIYKSSGVDSTPHCLPFAMVTKSCRDGKVARRSSSSTKKKVVNSAERNRIISDRKCSPRRKLDNDLSVTNCVRSLPSDVHGKVRESVAVVKSSQDPYQDFRSSMLEMILEKQIYHSNDLEQLLQCFLSLNSRQHHEIIVQVFTEIWGKMFCSCRNPSTPVTVFLGGA